MSVMGWEPAPPSPSRARKALHAARRGLGVVDYTLAKRALLREFRSGLLSRLEICDAHPELIRAAKNTGSPVRRPCPVCRSQELCLMAYVYGEGLQHQNGRPYAIQEALSLAASHAGAA